MADIIIVGGGLAGLALAVRLHHAGEDALLIEARDRLGGRIHGLRDGGHTFDLGPSWYWPGQSRMAHLADELGLTTFDQHAAGNLMFEGEDGQVQRGVGYASMEGSFRISGGMTAMIDGLAEQLPAGKIRLDARVVAVHKDTGVTLESGETVAAKTIVIACPPRVAARIKFTPNINHTALEAVPTWMGGQAKFIATYDTPFWRSAGLSGDAMSRRGPLAEIHDASSADGEIGALFGFVGVPPEARLGRTDAILSAALDQLARLFGEAARTPRKAQIEDWAAQSETASALDQQPLYSHPTYGMPSELVRFWDGHLHFGSTEVAHDYGGFLEGALARADELARILT